VTIRIMGKNIKVNKSSPPINMILSAHQDWVILGDIQVHWDAALALSIDKESSPSAMSLGDWLFFRHG
jgi:hypothetical protein